MWYTLGLMIAKRNIARAWGAALPPNIQDWQRDLDWCMSTERVIYEGRGCLRKWSKIWGKWNTFRGEICSNEVEDSTEIQGNTGCH